MLALQIPDTLHDLEQVVNNYRWPRRGTMTNDCLIRQGNICPLTGRNNDDHPLQTGHLLPHAVASVESYADVPYWCLLSFILPPDVMAHVCRVAGGRNSSTLINGMAMDGTIHSQFSKWTIWLLPHVPDDIFDANTSTYYDVEFCWRGSKQGLGGLGTQLPESPEDQVDEAQGSYRVTETMRPMNIGDRFRIFTVDPTEYPLPDPLLLSLHAVLWEMISAAGLAEPDSGKANRLERYNGPATPRGRAVVHPNLRAGCRGSVHRWSRTRGSQADGALPPQPAPAGEDSQTRSHRFLSSASGIESTGNEAADAPIELTQPGISILSTICMTTMNATATTPNITTLRTNSMAPRRPMMGSTTTENQKTRPTSPR